MTTEYFDPKRKAFEILVANVAHEIPGFEIKFKNESWSSKLIGALVWVFNRRYLTAYTTTRYPRVFFPSRAYVASDYRRATKILAHEFVHLLDRQERGFAFTVAYALPQVLAVLALTALLAIVSPWGWLGLAPLVMLAPWPSPGRTEIELRGYAMSLLLNRWQYGSILDSTFDWVLDQFTGPNYYFMWWSRAGVRQRLDWLLTAAQRGTAGDVYGLVYRALYSSEGR